ncbi:MULTISPECIES: O-antigen ligase family protein [Acinetobacter]|uniref:O-antigen ligase family protein n=1 Tax=Acinetobacter TaxID=469 RepID=UPI0025798D25|nr:MULTISPECIES: O-antigen ligase family protein [Acinetobacter]
MYKYISIISLALLVLGWLYPYHYAPWLVAENEFFILLIPCFLSLPLIRNKEFKINELFIFPIILLLFSFIQYLLLDYYFLEDFILVSIYSIFILLVLIISQTQKNKEHIILILKTIIFLCLINSIIILFQYFNINSIFILEHTGTKRFYGNIGQPNHLSTLFMMGIVSSILLYNKKIIKIQLLYIISIYLILFVFLTGSRTGVLALLSLAFLGFIFRTKQSIKFSMTFFGTLILIYFLSNYLFSKNSRNSVKNLNETINDSRLALWSDSISSILANPWVGYGINGVRTSRLFGNLNFKTPYVSSHNLFLDLFLWFGVIGGIILSFYLIIFFIKVIKDKTYGYEILLFLTPFIIHSLLEYPFRYLYFLIFVIPALSLSKNFKIYKISRFTLLILFLIYNILISIFYLEFKKYSREAFFSQSQKCEIFESLEAPILMDLMYDYSKLYCNTLTEHEMRRVIYRYAYPIHIQYYIQNGFYDENLNRSREVSF